MRDRQVLTFLEAYNGMTAGMMQSSRPNICVKLSDILETGNVPRRYFLSAKAAQGILRRAKHRGRDLPAMLRLALEQVAGILINAGKRCSNIP